jgi:serine/threonine protein kinase
MHEGFADGLRTKEGTTLGTTPYMPPEQARGRPIDERADIFAVGATMFRLLTGRYLHDASTSFELLMRMGKEPAPRLATIAPTMPDDLCAVVDRALAFDKDERYRNARAMLEDMRALIAGSTPLHAKTPWSPAAQPASELVMPMTSPATSEIPVYFSDTPTKPSGVPISEVPTPPRIATLHEETLISPGNEPGDEPDKS